MQSGKTIKVAGLAVLLGIFFFTNTAVAHAQYSVYTGRNDAETIAYLQAVVAQLMAELQTRQQYGTAPYYYSSAPSGRVLGTSYYDYDRDYDDGFIDVETDLLRHDDDEFVFYGDLDLGRVDYAYVWFEYGDDRDMDERTSRKRMSRDGRFSADVDEDEFDTDEWNYYRAVAESPSGRRYYGETRAWRTERSSYYRYDRDCDRYYDYYDRDCDRDRYRYRDRYNDDEPDVDTDSADDIDRDSAVLRGSVDMNDFRRGVVFFVYGEDEDQVEDIEDDYDEYYDIDEDGDDLQKALVDSSLDGERSYRKYVGNLDEDERYYFQICVEYEDDDNDDVIECGGVDEFETDD